MNEVDERRYEYETQQRAPKPEPVYEYRVVCAGPWGPRPFGWPRGSYDGAVRVVKSLETTHHASHDHTIERRLVGPWEAT